jgi:hypothetical protein
MRGNPSANLAQGFLFATATLLSILAGCGCRDHLLGFRQRGALLAGALGNLVAGFALDRGANLAPPIAFLPRPVVGPAAAIRAFASPFSIGSMAFLIATASVRVKSSRTVFSANSPRTISARSTTVIQNKACLTSSYEQVADSSCPSDQFSG